MKKLISIAFALMAICNLTYANVPYRAVINGPVKIGCGSVYKYKATLQGLDESYIFRVDWYPCTDAQSHSVSGQYATVTAPDTAMDFVLECDVNIASPYNNSGLEVLHASITVNASEPSFSFFRENLNGINITDTSSVPIFGNVDFDGNQNSTDGNCSLAFYDDELLSFSVDVNDANLIANRGTVKLSVPDDYRLWDDKNRSNLLGNSGADITIVLNDSVELNDALANVSGAVEAKTIQKYKSLKFSFNSSDTFLPYVSYGVKHNSKPSNYDQIRSAVDAELPVSSDCQWRYVGQALSGHDNIAYSVVPSPTPYIYNGRHFRVNKTAPLCSNIYLLTEHNGSWATSMDTFGNRNGSFENTDIYAFFHSVIWGSMDLVGTIDCKVIYYDSYFAARSIPTTSNDYLKSGWRLFKAKVGNYLIAYIVEDSSEISMMFGQGEEPL